MFLEMFSILFWCEAKPEERKKKSPVRVKESLKRLFNEYYNESEDINNYGGVHYVEYNKDYDDEDEDSKADEITKIEKFFNVNINVIIM